MNRSLVFLCVVILVLTACSSGTLAPKDNTEEDVLKIGFVYNGPADDYGWTYAHDIGREYLEEEMQVDTDFKVALETDTEAVKAAMTEFAEAGYDVIVSTSAGYLPVAVELKKAYPNVTILHTQATKAEGITTIMPRFYQSKYLAGYAAGMMTENNAIGYISSYKFPESVMWVNGFAKGVVDANPDAIVFLKWAQTWDDPDVEKNLALELISEYDVDILAQEQNSPTIPQVAETNGRFAIGDYADMLSFAPNAIITTPALNWGPFYVQILEEYKEGTLKNDLYWLSMEESVGDTKATDITEFGSFVPQEVKDAVLAKRTEIVDGTFDPFPEIQVVEDLDGIELMKGIVELE